MHKSSSATYNVFSVQWWCERGSKSHVAKEISGRGRRRSRDEKGNQGVGDLRFINILQLFSIYFFQLLYFIIFFYTFFTHDIYPHPRPTTSTHYPRPTTFSYTPAKHSRHLRSPITGRLRIFVKRNPSRFLRFARSVRLLIECARNL